MKYYHEEILRDIVNPGYKFLFMVHKKDKKGKLFITKDTEYMDEIKMIHMIYGDRLFSWTLKGIRASISQFRKYRNE